MSLDSLRAPRYTGQKIEEQKTPSQPKRAERYTREHAIKDQEKKRNEISKIASTGTREDITIDKYEKKMIFTFTDTESDIVIKDSTTFFYKNDGELDATGNQMTVESQGKIVYENTGGQEKINEHGAWKGRVEELLTKI